MRHLMFSNEEVVRKPVFREVYSVGKRGR